LFEHVYTVWDFYDGPRDGLADFFGTPHYFKCRWDGAADNYSSEYDLSPVSSELVQIALTQWQIWKRWEAAFHAGAVAKDTHPGIGGVDRQYDELEAKIDAALATLGPPGIRAKAQFRAVPSNDQPVPGIMRELEVAWSTVA
jgi:hypothetical protein